MHGREQDLISSYSFMVLERSLGKSNQCLLESPICNIQMFVLPPYPLLLGGCNYLDHRCGQRFPAGANKTWKGSIHEVSIDI